MTGDAHQKVNAGHLKRNAYLYVRQSTIRQVFENTESTKRQYALHQNAMALGWPAERIIVIDSDLGQSGASAVDREGFQRLVAEVGIGKAGIVLGLEVSRLARNSTDWHRLLEICALTDTLILDEDGVYDPSHFNDRLLLGLKGTMSEAELHVLKARLQGGILNKARRGELQCPLPVGFVYNVEDQPVLDPDKQVQDSIRHFFEMFKCTGSAMATVKGFRKQSLLFPQRQKKGPRKGDLLWAELTHSRALQVLHNPRYAGAFVYGRKKTRRKMNGTTACTKQPRDQWILLPGVHPGYIGWEEYEDNQRRLRQNAQANGLDRRTGPPREGPALLQGLAVCGICGNRMTVRYHSRGGNLVPDYLCQRDGIQHGKSICQQVPGESVDQAIRDLLLQTMTPMTLDVALAVQQEVQSRTVEVDRLRQKQVERARYEADAAQRRYMHVDPANRLVADTLEAEWNSKLRALNNAQEEYQRLRQTDRVEMDETQKKRITALASDFPKLWQDSALPDRERKRIVRLLLDDVTLAKNELVTARVRFKGGMTTMLTVPRPMSIWRVNATDPALVAQIASSLLDHTDSETAAILNQRGVVSAKGQPFTFRRIGRIRRDYDLKSRYDLLREAGMKTAEETAATLGTCPSTVRAWGLAGLLRVHSCGDRRNQYLYEALGENPPVPHHGQKLSLRLPSAEVLSQSTQEAQCEA